MKANNTIENRVKCYGDNEMNAKANELREAGFNRVENAYWAEHWQKGEKMIILERCDESERPATTEPTPETMNANETTEFSELTHAGQCLDIYLHNTSEIYNRYTVPAITAVVEAVKRNGWQFPKEEAIKNLTFWTSWQGGTKNALQAAARLVKRYDHLTPTAKDIEQVTRNYAAYIVDCAKYEIENAK